MIGEKVSDMIKDSWLKMKRDKVEENFHFKAYCINEKNKKQDLP
jgi:hypothetical protein